MGVKDFLKEAFEDMKEYSGLNDSISEFKDTVKKFKQEVGIDLLKDFEYKADKNYLYVKAPSLSLKSMGGILAGNVSNIESFGSRYKIYDLNENIKYFSDYDISLILDRESITLYDSQKNKIGKVKEYAFSVGVPFFEKEVKKCCVYLKNNLICKLKKYESFGELCFETLEGDIRIKYDKNKPREFIITKNKEIARIYTPILKLKDEYVDKYLIEYEDTSNEEIILLTVLAIDIINI